MSQEKAIIVSRVISLCNEAKKYDFMKLANYFFAIAFEYSLDCRPAEIQYVWERSERDMERREREGLFLRDTAYYDLFVISDGLKKARIPVPLLKNFSFCYKEAKREYLKEDDSWLFSKETNKYILNKKYEKLVEKLGEYKYEEYSLKHLELGKMREKGFKPFEAHEMTICDSCIYYAANNKFCNCAVNPLFDPSEGFDCRDYEKIDL